MTEKLKEIFETTTKKELPDINESSSLSADLGLNSFELFDLICIIEEKYDISIPDRLLPTLVTVKDVVDYLEENV